MSWQARIGRVDKEINAIISFYGKSQFIDNEGDRTRINVLCNLYNHMHDNKAIILEVEKWS